jgi:hypothetical protein
MQVVMKSNPDRVKCLLLAFIYIYVTGYIVDTVIILLQYLEETCYLSTDFAYVNFVDITSKFRTFTKFESSDLEFVIIFTVNLRTTFHMPNTSSSLVIAVKPKAVYVPTCHAAAILLLCIVQNNYLNKGCMF